MTKLYARVGPRFDPATPSGVLVAAQDLSDTYGFTEEGYDTADYDAAPVVVKVVAKVERWAGCDDVHAAAEKAGIRPWATFGEKGPEEGGGPLDEREPNELLFEPDVVRHLEDAGFQAFRDHVCVSNEQPLVSAFWNPSTFEVSAPLELVAADPASPYDVRLAERPSPAP